ncbi:MAG TPA: GNAT family N-acetyltransferase [archaeon]|nr:GNAT family N-acetyltransferase [archaeon]
MKIVGPYPAVTDPELLNTLLEFVGFESKTKYSWESYLTSLDFIYTAIDNGTPVGIGAAMTDGNDCYIISVCVHPDYQRRQIGRGIIEQVVKTAKERGYARARLNVPKRNPSVKEFYKKLGFRSTDELAMDLNLQDEIK